MSVFQDFDDMVFSVSVVLSSLIFVKPRWFHSYGPLFVCIFIYKSQIFKAFRFTLSAGNIR